ncbi:hypothetical protein HL42_8193 [Trichophyton rubrum]|nr:hypothetical protein HL42_8193 [Trichophyton rubrum]
MKLARGRKSPKRKSRLAAAGYDDDDDGEKTKDESFLRNVFRVWSILTTAAGGDENKTRRDETRRKKGRPCEAMANGDDGAGDTHRDTLTTYDDNQTTVDEDEEDEEEEEEDK